jgi:hypothetical protein
MYMGLRFLAWMHAWWLVFTETLSEESTVSASGVKLYASSEQGLIGPGKWDDGRVEADGQSPAVRRAAAESANQ